MATKRKTTRLRGGRVLAVEEYHDGRYGAPGMPRQKKRKPTKEDMQRVNAMNKARRCQYRLIQYFASGDYFATITYKVSERPPDMETAMKHWDKLIRTIRKEYRKRGAPLFWIRNIERGTKGAWHIHLVITKIPETAQIIEDAWPYGGVYITQLKKDSGNGTDHRRCVAVWRRIHHTAQEEQVLQRGLRRAGRLHDERSAHTGEESGRHRGCDTDQRSQLQQVPQHAAPGAEKEEAGQMAKRGKAEERLLHRADPRGHQPCYGVQIPPVHHDPAEQEDLIHENSEDLHRDIISVPDREGWKIRIRTSIYWYGRGSRADRDGMRKEYHIQPSHASGSGGGLKETESALPCDHDNG